MPPQATSKEEGKMPSVVPIPEPLEHSSSQRGAHDAAANSAAEGEFPSALSRDSSRHIIGHAGSLANGSYFP